VFEVRLYVWNKPGFLNLMETAAPTRFDISIWRAKVYSRTGAGRNVAAFAFLIKNETITTLF